MKDNEFKNDPLFAALNKFAGAPKEESVLPLEIRDAFASGRKKARIKKYSIRSAFSALMLAITLPALASANVLPAPVKEFVQKVQHAAATPVKNLIGITNTQIEDDEVTSVEDQQDEFPVDKEAKAEIKAAKEEAKEESKVAKEAQKDAAKEAAKDEAKNVREVAKEETKAAKDVAKTAKESAKERPKDKVKENKGQSKK